MNVFHGLAFAVKHFRDPRIRPARAVQVRFQQDLGSSNPLKTAIGGLNDLRAGTPSSCESSTMYRLRIVAVLGSHGKSMHAMRQGEIASPHIPSRLNTKLGFHSSELLRSQVMHSSSLGNRCMSSAIPMILTVCLAVMVFIWWYGRLN